MPAFAWSWEQLLLAGMPGACPSDWLQAQRRKPQIIMLLPSASGRPNMPVYEPWVHVTVQSAALFQSAWHRITI